jgi:Ca2+-binding EF-hand superfamily protein
MSKFITAGAIAIAVVAAPVSAQPAPPPPPGVAQGTAPMAAPPVAPGARGMRAGPQVHMMIMSDRAMTRDEVSQHIAKLFARLDANHDGFVTRDELEALHSTMMMGMGGMKRGMDAMSHGMHAMSVAPAMPMPDRAAMFDRLDTNHDGSISRSEYMAAKPQIREQRTFVIRDGNASGAPGTPGEHNMMMRMPGMGRGMGHAMGMGMGGFGGHLFEMADANHDGRVSLAEAQGAALAHFDRADLNRDGRITPDERQQMHQVIRMERRPS